MTLEPYRLRDLARKFDEKQLNREFILSAQDQKDIAEALRMAADTVKHLNIWQKRHDAD